MSGMPGKVNIEIRFWFTMFMNGLEEGESATSKATVADDTQLGEGGRQQRNRQSSAKKMQQRENLKQQALGRKIRLNTKDDELYSLRVGS